MKYTSVNHRVNNSVDDSVNEYALKKSQVFCFQALEVDEKIVRIVDMDIDDKIRKLSAEISRLQQIKQGDPVFPPECQSLLAKRICLNCGKTIAKTARPVRGNHEACHRQTLRAIESGRLTDFSAVEAGLFAPKAKAGAKPKAGTRLAEVLADESLEIEGDSPAEEAEFLAQAKRESAKNSAKTKASKAQTTKRKRG